MIDGRRKDGSAWEFKLSSAMNSRWSVISDSIIDGRRRRIWRGWSGIADFSYLELGTIYSLWCDSCLAVPSAGCFFLSHCSCLWLACLPQYCCLSILVPSTCSFNLDDKVFFSFVFQSALLMVELDTQSCVTGARLALNWQLKLEGSYISFCKWHMSWVVMCQLGPQAKSWAKSSPKSQAKPGQAWWPKLAFGLAHNDQKLKLQSLFNHLCQTVRIKRSND